MFVYIARDDDGWLAFHEFKPDKHKSGEFFNKGAESYVNRKIFPEIKPGECRKFKLVEVK